MEALEKLLSRVPDGQRDLEEQIGCILSKERDNEREAGEVEGFMEFLKKKKYVTHMNRAWNILKGER